MRKLFIVISGILLLAACSRDEGQDIPEPSVTERVIKEGMEMYSQMLVDDRIVEESVDKVVNYGNENIPLLYHVNQRHTLNGANVPDGKADMDCSFYSLTEKEHLDFIKIFAVAKGIASSENLTDEQMLSAFICLSDLLYATKIELALLVYLADNNIEEIKALDRMLENSPIPRSANNNLNSILSAMVKADIRPTEMLRGLEAENITFAELVNRADLSGADIPEMIRSRAGVTGTIKAVVKGMVIVSKVIVAFIENAKPVVNIESTYASYLNEGDLDPLNYYGAVQVKSQKYECRYGTAGAPLAQCIFYIEGYTQAKHKSISGHYIPRVGMLVERVRASGGMHVEGSVAYSPGGYTLAADGYIAAYCTNDITVEYGDCCCFARTARLSYWLDATQGFLKF